MDGLPEPAFLLGVERSFSGKRWLERSGDARQALALAQTLDLPEIVARVLTARGVDAQTANSFLEPRLATLLPDPAHLLDMDAAVDRLVHAIRTEESVAVFGDYDVDGATSSALLDRYFRAVGRRLRVYIPDRLKEGYGPNTRALMKLKEEGVRVVVTVDCGTTAYGPLEDAAGAGLDVIVADHHVAEAGLPKAAAVVNPNRIDDPSPHGQIAAVGVVFLLIVALNRGLRAIGYFTEAGIAEPDLMQWLDLVALGTVADVVPLTGVNRAFVTQGLKVMMRRENKGIAALADQAGVDETPNAYHLGYILGPRVNAGGRVGEAPMGARLLATEDAVEADELAKRLNEYNLERRALEAEVQEAAIAQAEGLTNTGGVFVAGEGWHPGVIGIVASRLKDRYGVPACVVALTENGATGSGRSVSGIDLGAIITAARQQGILINGGGHAMAAGFSLNRDRLDDLRDFLAERIETGIVEKGIVPTLYLEGVVSLAAANLELISALETLAPFGTGNAEPRFAIPDVRIAQSDVVGANHIRCRLTDAGGNRLAAIAFGAVDNDLGAPLLNHGGTIYTIAGRLRNNRWQGRESAQLLIDDLAESQPL